MADLHYRFLNAPCTISFLVKFAQIIYMWGWRPQIGSVSGYVCSDGHVDTSQETRMHSSRMCTDRGNGHLLEGVCIGVSVKASPWANPPNKRHLARHPLTRQPPLHHNPSPCGKTDVCENNTFFDTRLVIIEVGILSDRFKICFKKT